MTRPPLALPLLALALAASTTSGCAGDPQPRPCPPYGDAGVAKPTFVHDRTIQEVLERYQITLVKSTTAKGGALTCGDIPGVYSMGHPDVVILSTQPINRPSKDANATVVNNINFPVGQEMLVVVEGFARDTSGQAYLVARGCAQAIKFETCNPIPVGKDQHLEIDLIATTGAPCKGQSQGCEANMICLSDIAGGYCAKGNCGGDGKCPPASNCIFNKNSVGSCMRKCAEITDCKSNQAKGQIPWDCAYRKGYGGGSCQRVCVPPNWNFSDTCTPDS